MRQKVTDLLRAQVKALAHALCDVLFPPRCHCCKAFIPDAGGIHFCTRCRNDMTFITSPSCPVCGIPFLTPEGIDHCCSACISDPPPFAAARAPLVYDGPARDMIHLFKYERKVQLRRPLGLLVAEQLAPFRKTAAPHLVIPVPLHPKRLRERGFNQAVLLGEMIARQWAIGLCRTNLKRIRWTAPQMELSAAQRASNVRGAFALENTELVAGKRILLVDDVYTTGATLGECARTLRRGGAAEVFAVAVARAVQH